jgi:hypothetical protein
LQAAQPAFCDIAIEFLFSLDYLVDLRLNSPAV